MTQTRINSTYSQLLISYCKYAFMIKMSRYIPISPDSVPTNVYPVASYEALKNLYLIQSLSTYS